MITSELYHHQRLGAKWGKRNGPPYPLDYKQLSPEQKQKAKFEAIRTTNIKEINANIDEFSFNELNHVLDRYDLNRRVKSITQAEVKTGEQKLRDFNTYLQRIVDISSNGIKLYNNVAGAANAYNKYNNKGEKTRELPSINVGGGDGKKKKQNIKFNKGNKH